MEGWDLIADDLLEKGPVACLTFSFDKALHSISKTSSIYKDLVNELESNDEIARLWTVHDRSLRAKFNAWHPLIITANLSDLFETCNSIDQQIQRYSDEMERLQRVLIGCPAFARLCESLKLPTQETI